MCGGGIGVHTLHTRRSKPSTAEAGNNSTINRFQESRNSRSALYRPPQSLCHLLFNMLTIDTRTFTKGVQGSECRACGHIWSMRACPPGSNVTRPAGSICVRTVPLQSGPPQTAPSAIPGIVSHPQHNCQRPPPPPQPLSNHSTFPYRHGIPRNTLLSR